MTDRFGAKWVVFAGAAGPCLLAALTPVVTRAIGAGGLIAIRTLTGAFHGMVYSGVFSLNSRWYPPKGELATANAGLVFGSALGSAAMFLLAGWLSAISGWAAIFYVNAALYLPWAVGWVYCTDDPASNGRISSAELAYIEANVPKKSEGKQQQQQQHSARWSSIFTSLPVLTSLVTKCCCGFGYYLLQTKMPAYLATIHAVSIFSNGLFNSLTTVAHGLCALLAAPLANAIIRRLRLRVIHVRKAFQTVAMLGPAACFALIPVLGHAENTAAVIGLLVGVMLLYGLYTGGEWSTIAEYAPHSAGVIFGFSSILSFSQGVIAPYLIGVLLDASPEGDRLSSWSTIFYLTTGIYTFGAVVFLLGGTDVHQEWDKTEEEKEKKKIDAGEKEMKKKEDGNLV